MRSIRHFFEQSWLLIAASFFFGLLIAVTNAALSARIAWNATAKLNTLAANLVGSQTVVGASGTTTLALGVFNRALLAVTPFTGSIRREAWATQRSRGSFGRPNPPPF